MSPGKPDTHEHPPKPRLAFRVGVVGHRPNRLEQANLTLLSDLISKVLTRVKVTVEEVYQDNPGLFSDEPLILRAISPLAEGSDRIFAQAALKLGFTLCCPMPFPQKTFENDFQPGKALNENALAEFHGILFEAQKDTGFSRFELDGDPQNDSSAYAACGRIVLNQSDLLVVIWDGEDQKKTGGTDELFKIALLSGTPVIWIDARTPHGWQVMEAFTTLPKIGKGERHSPLLNREFEEIRKVVLSSILPPELSNKAEKKEIKIKINDFYGEIHPPVNWGFPWKTFRDLMGENKISFAGFTIPGFEKSLSEKDWPVYKPDTYNESTAIAFIINKLRPYYAWPDKLAVYYSDLYRSAVISEYLLAALAVGMALLPLAGSWIGIPENHGETICIIAELIMISAIIMIILIGQRQRWHERWLNYRLGAEMVRHSRMMVPLGGGLLFPQFPVHWAGYEHPAQTGMAWYVRAAVRSIGLPSVSVNKELLEISVRQLKDIIIDQLIYHQRNYVRNARTEKKLHSYGLWLFYLTFFVCLLHFVPMVDEPLEKYHWIPLILACLCGFLPAMGAALAGINNQGEFRRISKRSNAMIGQLSDLLVSAMKMKKEIKDASSPDIHFLNFTNELTNLTTQVTQLMANEVLDWRVVLLDRPIPSDV